MDSQCQNPEKEEEKSPDTTAFHQLVPDCRKLILSYHFFRMHHNDLPSNHINKPEAIMDVKFALEHFKCELTLDGSHEADLGFFCDLPLLTNLYSMFYNGFSAPSDMFSFTKNLVELTILDKGALGDEMFQHLESLEVLSISRLYGAEFLTDKIFTYMKKLRSLRIRECKLFTDQAIENLINAGSRLEMLEIYSCPQFTDHALALLEGQPIDKLRICHCDHITSKGLQRLQSVKSLCLGGMKQLNSHEAFKCLDGSAQRLIVFWSSASHFDEKAMSYLKGIHTLKLTGASIDGLTDAAFTHLKGSIKCLVIRECKGLEGLSKKLLWNLSGIEHVKLWDTDIRIEAEDLPRLKEVFSNVSFCEVGEHFADDSVLQELQDFIEKQGGVFDIHYQKQWSDDD